MPATNTIHVYAESRGRGTCRGCGAAMTWAEIVTTGKRMPFTGDPVPLRTYHHDEDRRLIEVLDFAENHWAQCPNKDQFKKGR